MVGGVPETDQRDSCHPKALESILGKEKDQTVNVIEKHKIGKTETNERNRD